MRQLFFLLIFLQLVADNNYYYRNTQQVFLQSLPYPLETNASIDYYNTKNMLVVGVTNKLIIKIKDKKSLENYLNEFNLKIVKSLTKNLYLLQTKDKSLTLDISNKLSQKEDVEYAHPDFIKKKILR